MLQLKELEASTVLSKEGSEFVKGLVELNTDTRLGTDTGSAAIRGHPWLAGYDLATLRDQSAKAPFMPNVNVANCDTGSNDAEEVRRLWGEGGSKVRGIRLGDEFKGHDDQSL